MAVTFRMLNIPNKFILRASTPHYTTVHYCTVSQHRMPVIHYDIIAREVHSPELPIFSSGFKKLSLSFGADLEFLRFGFYL